LEHDPWILCLVAYKLWFDVSLLYPRCVFQSDLFVRQHMESVVHKHISSSLKPTLAILPEIG
jgi:hypothetical protein